METAPHPPCGPDEEPPGPELGEQGGQQGARSSFQSGAQAALASAVPIPCLPDPCAFRHAVPSAQNMLPFSPSACSSCSRPLGGGVADWHGSPRLGAPPQRMGSQHRPAPGFFQSPAPLRAGAGSGPSPPILGSVLGGEGALVNPASWATSGRVSGCIPAGPHVCSSINSTNV